MLRRIQLHPHLVIFQQSPVNSNYQCLHPHLQLLAVIAQPSPGVWLVKLLQQQQTDYREGCCDDSTKEAGVYTSCECGF